MERRIFWLLSAAIVLLALVLREQYVLQVSVLSPFAGDAGYYVRYAQHIAQGYFGIGDVPDAYRPPGYPALIALARLASSDPYTTLLQWQALMGTATVGLTIGLARQWLPQWAALLAGVLLALWPHHIAFSAEVLSEVPYGFLLTAALLVAAVAKDRTWVWACAGLLFACAAMVNSASVLLPIIVAAILIGRKAPVRWVALLAPVVLIVGGWSLRPAEGGSDRIWQNLVQGSQPMYHEAYVRAAEDPAMAAVMREIDGETGHMVADPHAGMRSMASRLLDRPGHYAAWYATKPWLLWDWSVRISPVGGPYMHAVARSPLDVAPMQPVTSALRALNPLLFALSMAFALYAAVRLRGPAQMLALAFLYFTAVHVVLQAEPRYSIPYRPIQIALAAGALAWAAQRIIPTLKIRTGSYARSRPLDS